MSERVIWQADGLWALVDLGPRPYFTRRGRDSYAEESRFPYDLLTRDSVHDDWERVRWDDPAEVSDALSALIDYFGAYVTAHPGDNQMDNVEVAALERRVLECVSREDFAGAQEANAALLRLHFSSREEKHDDGFLSDVAQTLRSVTMTGDGASPAWSGVWVNEYTAEEQNRSALTQALDDIAAMKKACQ